MGIHILDATWVHRHGTDSVITEVERIVGDRPAYFTFDIDCLDPPLRPALAHRFAADCPLRRH